MCISADRRDAHGHQAPGTTASTCNMLLMREKSEIKAKRAVYKMLAILIFNGRYAALFPFISVRMSIFPIKSESRLDALKITISRDNVEANFPISAEGI